tara:strand:- start:1055 stop:2356 length:1302 start_codon:yes stop_codon:yes gene_type:complete
VSKFFIFFLIGIIFSSCSLNKNSKFWTSTKDIDLENPQFKKILDDEKILDKTFNQNLKIKLSKEVSKDNKKSLQTNDDGRINFNGTLEKTSRYKFSKIKNFYQYEPEISFNNKNIIFFDNTGAILKFDNDSNLLWKKNYYSKNEKKQNPILQFSNNGKYLVVADNLANVYALDLKTGNQLWTKNNLAPFNSQIKIYKDKFFIVDFSNTLRCFSILDGKELWNVVTENSLIRSNKKLSMVISNNKIFFNNSIGDITAVDIDRGETLWQLPTQSSSVYESAFSLETSDLIINDSTLYFSNNRNQIFSIDTNVGNFNWEHKVNSNIRPSVTGNLLFTISLEGYLVVMQKKTGNIIRITDIFENFKLKKRSNIKPIGFIMGLNNIYLSTSNGRLLVIDIVSGKTTSTLKIDNDKISRPLILDKSLFVIKENAIIKLN